jgi:hypothetical protein
MSDGLLPLNIWCHVDFGWLELPQQCGCWLVHAGGGLLDVSVDWGVGFWKHGCLYRPPLELARGDKLFNE